MSARNQPRPELSMRQLRHFLLVAEHGSFQSAAGKAHRSQPAITKSVQAVEQFVGQALFEPGHRTTLTSFGQACLPLVRELLLHYERTASAIQALATGSAGSLSIAAIASLATHWLPPLVHRFMSEHPRVAIRLCDDNSEHIQRMVLAGEVDFGLCSAIGEDARLESTPLLENRFGFVCRRDHPLASRRSLEWSAIDDQPLIWTTAHRQITHGPAVQVLLRARLHTDNMISLLSALQGGLGVTVLGELAIPPEASSLAFIPLVAPRVQRTVSLMRLRDRTPSPAASIMMRMLVEHAGQQRRPASGKRSSGKAVNHPRSRRN
jgi:DNA-binding transcriptional LysR family regulator